MADIPQLPEIARKPVVPERDETAWSDLREFAGRMVDAEDVTQCAALVPEIARRLATLTDPEAKSLYHSFRVRFFMYAEGNPRALCQLVVNAVRALAAGFPTPAMLRRRRNYKRSAELEEILAQGSRAEVLEDNSHLIEGTE